MRHPLHQETHCNPLTKGHSRDCVQGICRTRARVVPLGSSARNIGTALWYQLAMRELPAGVPGNWLDPWFRVEKRQCQRNRGVQPRETM